ncbi:hypothetical protein EVAR_5350_1 [Eumeta japonica]|uniref:Uncharacterized protein n=1 Tax=Eumeta variegata TaxID=151549 RepID=A0A4C1TMW9_EUMVA|nr:hypothetical protein EVAR_5350_1 [Eumeta japonica]
MGIPVWVYPSVGTLGSTWLQQENLPAQLCLVVNHTQKHLPPKLFIYIFQVPNNGQFQLYYTHRYKLDSQMLEMKELQQLGASSGRSTLGKFKIAQKVAEAFPRTSANVISCLYRASAFPAAFVRCLYCRSSVLEGRRRDPIIKPPPSVYMTYTERAA